MSSSAEDIWDSIYKDTRVYSNNKFHELYENLSLNHYIMKRTFLFNINIMKL